MFKKISVILFTILCFSFIGCFFDSKSNAVSVVTGDDPVIDNPSNPDTPDDPVIVDPTNPDDPITPDDPDNPTTDPVTVVKNGKFAVKQMTKSNISKSIIPMDGGDVYDSTVQYFILQNVGTEDITNIKMYILSSKEGYIPTNDSPDTDFITAEGNINTTNFTEVTSGFSVTPTAITVLSPVSETSVIQMIEVRIEHGNTVEGIGYASVISKGANKKYIVITGETTKVTEVTDAEGTVTTTTETVKLQMNVSFSVLIKLAEWTISADPNPTVTNTGNVKIAVGTTLNTLNTTTAWGLNIVDGSYVILQPGEHYTSGDPAINTTGDPLKDTMNLNAQYVIYTYNTVMDYTAVLNSYPTLGYSVQISNPGNVVTYR